MVGPKFQLLELGPTGLEWGQGPDFLNSPFR